MRRFDSGIAAAAMCLKEGETEGRHHWKINTDAYGKIAKLMTQKQIGNVYAFMEHCPRDELVGPGRN